MRVRCGTAKGDGCTASVSVSVASERGSTSGSVISADDRAPGASAPEPPSEREIPRCLGGAGRGGSSSGGGGTDSGKNRFGAATTGFFAVAASLRPGSPFGRRLGSL